MRLLVLLIAPALPHTAAAQTADAALDAVIVAYPYALARHDGRVIVFRDGTILPVHDGLDKSDARQLHRASILDQFHHAYPRGLLTAPPLTDPGPGALSQRGLHQQDVWRLPQWRGASAAGRGAGKPVYVTRVNGVADPLRAVSAEIDALPAATKRATWPAPSAIRGRFGY
jgi:hypothetical protein